MARSRPKWLPTDKDLKLIEDLAAIDCTQEIIANALGIASTTFSEKKGQIKEIREALDRGDKKGHQAIIAALHDEGLNKRTPQFLMKLVESRIGGKYAKTPDIVNESGAATIVFGWMEKPKEIGINGNGKNGNGKPIINILPEDTDVQEIEEDEDG